MNVFGFYEVLSSAKPEVYESSIELRMTAWGVEDDGLGGWRLRFGEVGDDGLGRCLVWRRVVLTTQKANLSAPDEWL